MTTFPPHIANAPTPRTDNLEWEQACNYDVPWEEHHRQLERQLIWLSEVVELARPSLKHHHDNLNRSQDCNACKFLAALNEYKQGTKEV